MGTRISSISTIRAARGKIALALGILAVLAVVLTVFAVADYPETDGGVTYGKVTVTGGGEDDSFSASPCLSSEDGDVKTTGSDASAVLVITTVDELKAFRNNVNNGETYLDKTVLLNNDLDLSKETESWTPIGDGFRKSAVFGGKSFQGTFDGNGHTINGLKIQVTLNTDENVQGGADTAEGLFGVVSGGTVKNLNLTNVSMSVTNGKDVGAVVGLLVNNGTVSECTVGAESGDSSSITAKGGIGGIVGMMTLQGTIENCANYAGINAGGGKIGGIVGGAYYTEADVQMVVTGCVNHGAIGGSGYIGGIVGLSTAVISDCHNHGAVTSNSGTGVGGIVGEQKSYGRIENCSNDAVVDNKSEKAEYGTGGIVGWVRYQLGTEYQRIGTIAITGCTNSANVISKAIGAGGIAGMVYHSIDLTGCNASGSVSGTNMVGGLIGGVQYDKPCPTGGCGLVVADCVTSCTVSKAEGQPNMGTAVGHAITSNCSPLRNGSLWIVYNITVNSSQTDVGTGFGDLCSTVVSTDTDGKMTAYSSLQDAIDASTAGSTVILCEDVKGAVTIDKSKNLTIDLNGKRIVNSSSVHTIINGGNLTIKDSVGGGIVDNITHGKATLYNESGATVELDGGTFKRSDEKGAGPKDNGGNSYYTIQNLGSMTVNDGVTVENSGKYSSCFVSGWYNGAQAKANGISASLTINGGKFTGGLNTIKNDDQSTSVINGGTFENYVQSALYNAHIAEVNSGTFTVETGYAVICLTPGAAYDGKLTINGGTFNGGILLKTKATLTVGSSLSLSDNAVLFVSAGAQIVIKEGVAADMGFVASRVSGMDTLYYKSLETAVSAASKGATVNILGNASCTECENDKSLIFTGTDLLKHNEETVADQAATCTKAGLTEGKKCSDCGKVLKSQETIPATGHKWDSGAITKQPTEGSEGVKTYTCTACQITKTEAIPKLDCVHVWDSGTVTEKSTCGATGSKTFKCTKCSETKTESIPATGNHSWDEGTVTKGSTTTQSGTIEYKCEVCGQIKTATIDPKTTTVEEKDGVKTTTEIQKIEEESDDGTKTVTETTTISKEENGTVEKVETTKSKTTSGSTTIESETTVTEKAGEKVETTKSKTTSGSTTIESETTVTEKAGEKVETSKSTTITEEKTTIVSDATVIEKGGQKTETIAVTIESEDKSVKTDVSVSDGSTSGIKTVITGTVSDDVITSAVKQVDMATEAISDKVAEISKTISVATDNVTLSPVAFGTIASSGVSLTITGDAGSIGIDSSVAVTMTSQVEDVTISINEKKDGLTDAQKAKAGENKVIELSAKTATKDIHELGGTARVMIDMTDMDFKSPAVYWLKDDGTSVKVDAEFGEGYAAVELDHFSLYYIAETASSTTFIVIPDTSDDDFPGYVPTPSTDTTDSGSGDTAKIAILIGAIVVLLVAMVVLTHKSR